MKKCILSCLFFVFCLSSYAQLGVTLGLSFNKARSTSGGFDEDFETDFTSSNLTGVRGGLKLDLPVAGNFYIQPSLLYAAKGGKFKYVGTTKMTISYIEVPVNLLYKFKIGPGSIIGGAGPYISYALGGKFGGVKMFKEKDSNDEYLFKRLDYGVNLQTGYEFAMGFGVGVCYDLGLANIINNKSEEMEGSKMRTSSFAITLGYKFGGK